MYRVNTQALGFVLDHQKLLLYKTIDHVKGEKIMLNVAKILMEHPVYFMVSR